MVYSGHEGFDYGIVQSRKFYLTNVAVSVRSAEEGGRIGRGGEGEGVGEGGGGRGDKVGGRKEEGREE